MPRIALPELRERKCQLDDLIERASELVRGLENSKALQAEVSSLHSSVHAQSQSTQEACRSAAIALESIRGMENNTSHLQQSAEKTREACARLRDELESQMQTLSKLVVRATRTQKTAEELLPGASSAGLACAFSAI